MAPESALSTRAGDLVQAFGRVLAAVDAVPPGRMTDGDHQFAEELRTSINILVLDMTAIAAIPDEEADKAGLSGLHRELYAFARSQYENIVADFEKCGIQIPQEEPSS